MNWVFALVCLGTSAGWISASARVPIFPVAAHPQTPSSSKHRSTSALPKAAAPKSRLARNPSRSNISLSSVRTNVVAVRHTAPPTSHAPASKKSGSSKNSKRKGGGRKHSAGPSYQLHPDPERYTQIQKALADRGYFKGTTDGTWGDDSVDAMRRFQTDQKLEPDGKITAPALIGLGLGPIHDGRSGHDVEAPAPAPPTEVAPGQTPSTAPAKDEESEQNQSAPPTQPHQ